MNEINFQTCLLDKVYIHTNPGQEDTIEISFRAINPTKEQIKEIHKMILSNQGHRNINFKWSIERGQYFIAELGENNDPRA